MCKHDFQKDKTFDKNYCRENIYPKYREFYWQSERFVCKHCGKVTYRKVNEIHQFFVSDEMEGLLR